MSSLLPNDDAYRRTKLIRQGSARLDPVFDGFVARFREHFGFAPLSLTTDVSKGPAGRDPAPRLGVVLERSEQYRAFVKAGSGYDPTKQAVIARMFADALVGAELQSMFGLPERTPSSYDYADEIFVSFTDFERLAKIEAHESTDLEQFMACLELGEQLWNIQRLWGSPIVFVYNATQAEALNVSPVVDRWADAYFALVKLHDEFNYLSRTAIEIRVDSKENFDENYASNWYYYFK